MTQTTVMFRRLARGTKGIEAIVREYYLKNYGSASIDVAADMDRLRVTVSIQGYKKIYRIQRVFIDNKPMYCVHVLKSQA